jgi:dihydrofolate synthase/folylpolyglutamate synthase
MNYRQTLDYLYTMLPMFHRIGPAAYKNDLHNTLALCEALGHPERAFKSVHIAGTNGKGSVSHTLAAVLQESGLKTGLYTSPHLLDFRERIRLNGQMIPETFVIDFVEKQMELIAELQPSFFEVTVGMAFAYFREAGADIAVIETGLGGRLDSTNVITPLLSIITNISYDHQNLLGETLPEIASEKAGIIKPGIPVLIGKKQPETEEVFRRKAASVDAVIYFAEDHFKLLEHHIADAELTATYLNTDTHTSVSIQSPLSGEYQLENLATVLQATEILRKQGLPLSEKTVAAGIKQVKKLTGLRGRWEILGTKPLIICDVAHNEAGLKAVFSQVDSIPHERLHLVYGMVKDKDISKALLRLPEKAVYYFCRPDIPRGLEVEELQEMAAERGLRGQPYQSVAEAFRAACKAAHEKDIVLVAGSIFVAAEVLAEADQQAR